MLRKFVFLMLVILYANVVSADCKNKIPIGDFYSKYKIVKVQRYRGGLTSKEKARSWIGKTISISPQLYKIMTTTIKSPVYRLKCYDFSHEQEGVVEPQRFSSSYGFKSDRKYIRSLEVYESAEDKEPYDILEIINKNELWNLYDGWIYMMSRVKQ